MLFGEGNLLVGVAVTFQETMTLISEGVQLLCLIDKGQDACRYLQTYGEWHHSVWLAKSTLDERDVAEVFSRWADHLTSVGVNQKVNQ